MNTKYLKRYVDDSFAILKNAVSGFYTTLYSINPHISFTVEHQNKNKLEFLDTEISTQNRTIIINNYRKPHVQIGTLIFNLHHDKKLKASTVKTLIHRSFKLPNTNKVTKRADTHNSRITDKRLPMQIQF